jgi:hypothetical protein
MSSAVLLLSSVISAIPHLPRSLTTPLGDVRSPYVCRYGPKHACRIDRSLHVTAAPPRVGSLHRTPPVRRILPEHQRGLQTGEACEACHVFTPPAVLDTPCRTESAHRTCSAHQDMCVTAERVPTLGQVDQQRYPANSASRALASNRSAVSKPSVNQPSPVQRSQRRVPRPVGQPLVVRQGHATVTPQQRRLGVPRGGHGNRRSRTCRARSGGGVHATPSPRPTRCKTLFARLRPTMLRSWAMARAPAVLWCALLLQPLWRRNATPWRRGSIA